MYTWRTLTRFICLLPATVLCWGCSELSFLAEISNTCYSFWLAVYRVAGEQRENTWNKAISLLSLYWTERRYLLAPSPRIPRLLLDWQCLLVAQDPKTERCLGQQQTPGSSCPALSFLSLYQTWRLWFWWAHWLLPDFSGTSNNWLWNEEEMEWR